MYEITNTSQAIQDEQNLTILQLQKTGVSSPSEAWLQAM